MNRRYRRLRSQFDPEGVGPLVTAPVFPFPNRTWLPAGRPFARRMMFETCRVDVEASESAPVSTRLESLQEVPLAGGAVGRRCRWQEVPLRVGAPAFLEVRRERSVPRPHAANEHDAHWGWYIPPGADLDVLTLFPGCSLTSPAPGTRNAHRTPVC